MKNFKDNLKWAVVYMFIPGFILSLLIPNNPAITGGWILGITILSFEMFVIEAFRVVIRTKTDREQR